MATFLYIKYRKHAILCQCFGVPKNRSRTAILRNRGSDPARCSRRHFWNRTDSRTASETEVWTTSKVCCANYWNPFSEFQLHLFRLNKILRMRCGGVTFGTEPDHLSCEPFLLEHDQCCLNLSTACSAREVHVMVGPYYEKVFRRQPEDGRTLSGINLEAIVIGRCGGRSASGSSLSLSPFIASQ
jgi:hypothetical protein